jgi:iron complex outermembrane receptor protein
LIRCVQQSGCVSNIQNPVVVNPNFNFTAPGNTFTMLYLTGTLPDLQPESSTGWSVGADVNPPIFPGLTFGATYWAIDFRNFISIPHITVNLGNSFLVPGVATICYDPPPAGQPNNAATQPNLCTQAQFAAFAALAPDSGPAVLAFVQSAPYNIAILHDDRVRNLGGAKISGADLYARFRHEVPFGSVDANVNIAIPIKNDFQLFPGAQFDDELATGEPKFFMTASVGATAGGFRAQATLRHRSGFIPDVGARRLASQNRIPSFTVVDLSFRYDIGGSSWVTEDLSLSLNINNVFNEDPPLNKTDGGGATNGRTLGRLIQFGISKRF